MATGTVMLPVGAAVLPDGSTSNAAASIQRAKSSAAAPTPHFLQLVFATDQMCMWSFRMPSDYASGPVLKVQFKMVSATSGNVVIEGRIAAVTDGDSQDVDAKAFAAANTSSATAVPGTAGFMKELSLTLSTADSLAAGDFTIAYLARRSSTATGNMEVVACSIEYTTT